MPFAFFGLSGDVKTNSKKELTYSATQNIDTVRKLFEENLGKKIKDASGKEVELTQEYIDEHIGQLEELGKMSEVYFSNKNLTEADKIAITDLLSRKRSFESKTTDDVSKNTFQSIINDINSSLNEYINKGSKTPFYVINGVAMSKEQVEKRLSDEDFVSGLKNGRMDVRIKNDKEMQSRFNDIIKVEKDTVPTKQKGRLTKFSTPQDGIVGEVTYEDGTKKELTQEEYDTLEKQEGLFDVETGTQPVTDNPALKDVESTAQAFKDAETSKVTSDIAEAFGFEVEQGVEEKIAKAYHKAKADGTNPELVKAVEQSLKEPPVQTETKKNIVDSDLENIDPTIIAARNGDKQAQEELSSYGIDWEQTTTYRFVGQSEVDVLLSNNKVDSKRKTDAGIDVTSSPEVTTATTGEYRVTFKESFDKNNGLGKVRSKNETDSNLEKGRGYDINDVAKIEKLDENGNVIETVYNAEQTETVQETPVEETVS